MEMFLYPVAAPRTGLTVEPIGNCFVVVGRMRSAECPFSFCYNDVEFVTFAIICTGRQELS